MPLPQPHSKVLSLWQFSIATCCKIEDVTCLAKTDNCLTSRCACAALVCLFHFHPSNTKQDSGQAWNGGQLTKALKPFSHADAALMQRQICCRITCSFGPYPNLPFSRLLQKHQARGPLMLPLCFYCSLLKV